MGRVYLAVEGTDDLEFVSRLLVTDGFERARQLKQVDPFWERLIPRQLKDIHGRVKVPAFFRRAQTTVAIRPTDGWQKFGTTLEADLKLLDDLPDSLGFIADADHAEAPFNRWKRLVDLLPREYAPESVGDTPGVVWMGPRRSGVYLLPGDGRPGVLEDAMVELAATVWPQLLPRVQGLVESLDADDRAFFPRSADRAELKRDAGRVKATAACVGAILRPGKALHASIEENAWICQETLPLPPLRGLTEFLRSLVNGV